MVFLWEFVDFSEHSLGATRVDFDDEARFPPLLLSGFPWESIEFSTHPLVSRTSRFDDVALFLPWF